MLEEILSKIKFKRGVHFGLLIFGILIAPYMFLFQFARNVFDTKALVPLLLIAVSIGAPIALILVFLFILDHLADDPPEKDKLMDLRISQMGSAGAITAVAFYLPCIAKYFAPSMSQKEAILSMISVLAAIIISSVMSIANGSTKKTHDAIMKLKMRKRMHNGQVNIRQNSIIPALTESFFCHR